MWGLIWTTMFLGSHCSGEPPTDYTFADPAWGTVRLINSSLSIHKFKLSKAIVCALDTPTAPQPTEIK